MEVQPVKLLKSNVKWINNEIKRRKSKPNPEYETQTTMVDKVITFYKNVRDETR